MGDQYEVMVGAGSFRFDGEQAVHFPHRWTSEGVSVDADFTGAQLLHLAVAGCVLNDTYREARALGIAIDGVGVAASGGFEEGTWASTGISYSVEVDSPATADEIDRLLEVVDAVAEIPLAVRAGAPVNRVPARRVPAHRVPAHRVT
jgi:uncharacterized OsmC-like protein